MAKPINILIVEDEMIIAANIASQLKGLGYVVSGIVSKGEDALKHIRNSNPDVVLFDIQLKGNLDGIETAILMQQDYDIPIIYLTANVDDSHFNRAKTTNPAAFLSKPFKKLDLQHAIELSLNHFNDDYTSDHDYEKNITQYVLSDRIFVKHNDKIVKIIIKDILYMEADRNYCRIHAKGKVYLLVATLKDIERKLPIEHFIRVHRSYIVNLSQIDEVANKFVLINRKVIPLGKTSRRKLLNRLQTI